ncbi:MAG: hypothetical protein NUV50_07035 [Rhodospirillales bacterium]|nr:hypothetical protein [Rhodospirillales bacterium]
MNEPILSPAHDDLPTQFLFRISLLAIGGVQGGAFYILMRPEIKGFFLQSSHAAISIFFALAPVLLILLLQRTSELRDVFMAVLTAMFTAGLYKFAFDHLNFDINSINPILGDASQNLTYPIAFIVTFLVVLIVPTPFYQAARTEGRFAFPYHHLFLFSWTNVLSILVAGFFVCIVWGLLFLWGQLFNLIGIKFFSTLFSQSWFSSIISGVAFGLGVALARERAAIIQGLLKLILTLFRILAPTLATIIVIFLLSLPFTGLDTLLNTHFAARILLTAVFFMILFQNAVIQAIDTANAFSRPTNFMVMAGNIALPVLAALAGASIFQRIDHNTGGHRHVGT